MSAEATFVSRYDLRVQRVRAIVEDGTKLDHEAAHTLAVRLLNALDTIPEKAR